jgi:dolichol-phosphate mannosyltransferase
VIWILLPAYNEELSFAPLIEKLRLTMDELHARFRVIVVNDGSKDGTSHVLEELGRRVPLEVLTHKYNRGLGETIRDGLEYIADHAQPDDVIVRMDCDDTHEPSYIPSMLAKLDEGYEVALPSRFAPGGGQVGLDAWRTFLSYAANLLFKLWFPIPGVREYSCGYRAYRASLIQDGLQIFGNKLIDLKGLGFTGTLEKLVKCRMLGARMAEVPFVLRYDQKVSASKSVARITILGCFVLFFKHMRWWGAEGQRWKEACQARRRRMADVALSPVRVRE